MRGSVSGTMIGPIPSAHYRPGTVLVMTSTQTVSTAALIADLSARIGAPFVRSNADDRQFFSQDVVYAGVHTVSCVVQPGTVRVVTKGDVRAVSICALLCA